MSAGHQHRPHDGQGWLGKSGREQRRAKRKPKRPHQERRRPYG